MTTGKRPFDGYHEMAVLYAVVNEDPAPVESLRPDAPPGLVAAINHLIQKSADARLCDLAKLREYIVQATPSGMAKSEPIDTVAIADGPPLLAVLPLENKSSDPEVDYLAEGFTEHATVGRNGRPARMPDDLRLRLEAGEVSR